MRFIAVILMLLAGTFTADGQDKKKKDLRRDVALKEGSVAPDFTLKDLDAKKTVKLAELKGKPVVLIFGSCT